MNIDNPQKIKKADIIVGIPSYNEAKTISFVIEQSALGLKKYFPDKNSVIINLDHESPDGTKQAFFNAKSDISRIYISTGKDIKGKGRNFYNLFSISQKLRAKAIIVFDADLRSIRPNWVKKMAEPIFDGFDYITPYYMRCKTDATITNHLVYPLIYSLFGWNIRQPIGGDFAFSNKMVDHWLKEKWPETAYQFGIDVFMSLGAFLSKAKTRQVNLGSKLHNLSNPKLGPMFYQVTETLFKIISDNLDKIKKINEVDNVPILGGKSLPILANAIPDEELFRSIFWDNLDRHWDLIKNVIKEPVRQKFIKDIKNKEIAIGLKKWNRIVFDFLDAYCKEDYNRSDLIEALGCLYFGRVVSFYNKNGDATPEKIEKEVVKRVKYFFKKRDYFLNKI